MSLSLKMEIDTVEDVTCLNPELLQLPEVSPFALKTTPLLVDRLFSQWLSLPETGNLDESNGADPEISKREKDRLKEMQKLKKQKIQGILDIQNAASDAEYSSRQSCLFNLVSYFQFQEEELKLEPIIAFDCDEIRERDWCNVVTCHMDSEQAYVWLLQNFVIGEHILRPCPENPTPVKACAISACGNFAVLGTAGGWIERFNLQSGISQGSYVDTPKGSAHDGESAAEGAIRET
ncbi:uncharacterized protein [Gossypium hirsutum]|uniref:Uncharacterized protein isoform X1 n=1 Tax=Gossypium hirsutum TaxID=3635 RepID=A0A1U8MVM1_GOSHI|nr:uncharacterized protein LOC107941787 isoform X1 [Gossypium hirsutum]XP_016730883.2 uncharacterized protein LOC107941787 isoform X1 [Gossypium hirsutum]